MLVLETTRNQNLTTMTSQKEFRRTTDHFPKRDRIRKTTCPIQVQFLLQAVAHYCGIVIRTIASDTPASNQPVTSAATRKCISAILPSTHLLFPDDLAVLTEQRHFEAGSLQGWTVQGNAKERFMRLKVRAQ